MPRRPNILLITSDQQHWRTLGCVGAPVQTPALDRLAADGLLAERAYCPNPTCTPSRASMITGQMPSQHRAYSLGTTLPAGTPTIGDCLHEAGYCTDLIGKAHFQPLESTVEHPSLEANPIMQDQAFWRQFHGPFHGFRHVELARQHSDEGLVGQHYGVWLQDRCGDAWRQHFRAPAGSRTIKDRNWALPPELHVNEWIVERSCHRLSAAAEAGQPFFQWASFPDPHPAYLVPPPWSTMYDPAAIEVPIATPGEHAGAPRLLQLTQVAEPDYSAWQEPHGNHLHGCRSHLHDRGELARDIAVYYGMISYLDHAVGRILAHLDHLGLADNTVVVFASDHGHFFGQHGLIAKGPFHYEDLLRVPFIVRHPGRIAAGTRSKALTSLVDLAPTLLAWAGLPVPHRMSGVDQGPVWRGETASVRDEVLVENRHNPNSVHLLTRIDGRYKITIFQRGDEGEIYDLQDDPGETRNLWADPAHADLRSHLLLRLSQASLAAQPLWMPRIASA